MENPKEIENIERESQEGVQETVAAGSDADTVKQPVVEAQPPAAADAAETEAAVSIENASEEEESTQKEEAVTAVSKETASSVDEAEVAAPEPVAEQQEEKTNAVDGETSEPNQTLLENGAAQETAAATESKQTGASSPPSARPESPAEARPKAPARSGTRRFASQGRRDSRENTEETTDPRMRRPAVYEPRSGPTHSRFNPRQPVAEVDVASINYKNVTVLTRFIDNQGRILSRRKSRVDAKTQRRIKTAIKQARHLALLPYTPTHIQGHRRR